MSSEGDDHHRWVAPEWGRVEVRRKKLWSAEDGEWLDALRQKYEAWRLAAKKNTGGERTEIPRVLHQIWLGPAPMPFEAYRARWAELHPGWEVRVWRESDVEALGLKNRSAFAAAKNYGEKSDVARYEILERFGGVYVDVDMEPLRSLEPLLGVGCFAGLSNVGAVEINNAVVGAVPGHPVLRALVAAIRPPETSLLDTLLASGFADPALEKTLADHRAASTLERTGPGLFTRVFCTTPCSDSLCLPPEVLYPAPNHVKSANDRRNFATPHTLAIHHWASTWQHTPPSTTTLASSDDDDSGPLQLHDHQPPSSILGGSLASGDKKLAPQAPS